jgi:S1-C subfamily serine protease
VSGADVVPAANKRRSFGQWRRRESGALGVLLAGFTFATSAVAAAPAEREPLALGGIVTEAKQSDSIGLGRDTHLPLLTEQLKKDGYAAFDESASTGGDAHFALGGAVTQVSCRAESNLTCTVAVRWELSDRRSDKVVYRVVTRARGVGSDGNALADQLLTDAIRSLTHRAKFARALVKGAQSTPPTARASEAARFRECARAPVAMPKAAQAILSATVLIESGDYLGSGTVISPDGYILTAAHVINPAAPLRVQLSSGQTFDAKVIRLSKHDDVALLLAVPTSGNPFTTVCLPLRADAVEVGEDVFAIGSPLGKKLSFSLTRGIVSGFRTIDDVPLIQTDASVNPGNSGGPLVDHEGRLIAVVDFKLVGQATQGLAFAVTTPAALAALGLQSGSNTDLPALSKPVVEPTAANEQAIVDDDDPPYPEDVQVSHGNSSTARSMRSIGVLAGTLGLVGVVTTWSMYELGNASPGMTESTFKTYRTFNTVSWAAFGIGLGSYLGSYLISDGAPAQSAAPRRKLYAGIGLGSLVVGGDL